MSEIKKTVITVRIDRSAAIMAGKTEHGDIALELPTNISYCTKEELSALADFIDKRTSEYAVANLMELPSRLFDSGEGWYTDTVILTVTQPPTAETWPLFLRGLLQWRGRMTKVSDEKRMEFEEIVKKNKNEKEASRIARIAEIESQDMVALHNLPWFPGMSREKFAEINIFESQPMIVHTPTTELPDKRRRIENRISYYAGKNEEIKNLLAEYCASQQQVIAEIFAAKQHNDQMFRRVVSMRNPYEPGTADHDLWTDRLHTGLMPEDEQLTIFRDLIFIEFEPTRIQRYKPLKSRDLAHKDDCHYEMCKFDSETYESGLTEEQYRIYRMTFEAIDSCKIEFSRFAKMIGCEDTNWSHKVAIKAHTAECKSCDESVTRISALVTVEALGRKVSREYDLEKLYE